MNYENSPRAGRSAFAGGHCERPHYRDGSAIKQGQSPRCELYGVLIVNELPDGCPFTKPEPGWAAFEFEQEGFWGFGDGGSGTMNLRRGKICGDCVNRNMANRVIQHIRLCIGADREVPLG